MLSAHYKELFGTLRFRLSAWNTAHVVVMVLVALVALREGLRYTLIREADQLLLEDVDELGLAVREFYPDLDQIHEEMNRKAKGHEHRQLFVQVLDPQGNDVWSSIHTPEQVKARPAFTRDAPPLTIAGYRVIQRQLAVPDLPAYTIRVGSSLAYVQEDISRLTKWMVLVGAVMLIAAPLGGYWLAGRATQPLGEIIRAAAGMRASRLDERLPLRHTRDELDQLSSTINGLLDRLAAYLEKNRSFTADAAHELRSPLAAIRSAVEVALNVPRTPDQYQELLGEIVEQISELSVLVNQLLLLAEGDDALLRDQPQPVRFDKIVGRAIEMFQGVAEERSVELRHGDLTPLVVYGDASRLREVVNNLIDNGLKFTPAGGHVRVALSFDARREQARLCISDSGMGIEPSELPRIFERFYRGDRSRARESQTRGTGLGLSICQAIVTAHGGRIEVDSAPRQGTTFVVSLPGARETASRSFSAQLLVDPGPSEGGDRAL